MIYFDITLGHNLHLVCRKHHGASGTIITACANNGDSFGIVAIMAAMPTDAIITAARATAVYLYADHVNRPAKPTQDEPLVRPHPFERDRTADRGVFRCKHCDEQPHALVHTAPVKERLV